MASAAMTERRKPLLLNELEEKTARSMIAQRISWGLVGTTLKNTLQYLAIISVGLAALGTIGRWLLTALGGS
jgi:hypothetical protein